ncbi:MAG TPA: hypothetical protein VFZ78_03625 [Flavisolibacter sp.]
MKALLPFIVFLVSLASCGNPENGDTPASENDLDAARNFIRAALDRKWPEARRYMLQDSANVERLEKIEAFYINEDREERRGYREASITTHEARKVNDSVTIVHYSNSFKNEKDSLKVVRVNGRWLVDFKYTFLPPDSSAYVD